MNRKLVSATIAITFIFVLLAIAGLTAGQYVLGAGLYDETVPVLTKTGTWTTGSNAGYWQGTVLVANATGGADTLSFYFYGDSFTLLVVKFSNAGDALVCIDSSCTTLNTFNSTTLFQVPITYSGLEVDTHFVEIITSTNQTAIDAIFINAVAPPSNDEITVQVTVEVTAEIVIEQTEEPYITTWDITDSEENIQTVAFEYKTDIGQFIIILMLFGVLLLGLIGLVFQVWAHFQNDTD